MNKLRSKIFFLSKRGAWIESKTKKSVLYLLDSGCYYDKREWRCIFILGKFMGTKVLKVILSIILNRPFVTNISKVMDTQLSKHLINVWYGEKIY